MSEYLDIRNVTKEGAKTEIYYVINKHHGAMIGTIKWYPNWRQYCFFPNTADIIVLNDGCMTYIAEFMHKLMEKYKASKKEKDEVHEIRTKDMHGDPQIIEYHGKVLAFLDHYDVETNMKLAKKSFNK